VYRDKDLLLTVTEEIVPVPYLPKPKPGEIFQASELRVDVGYSLNQATYQGSDFSGFSGELSFGKIFTSNLASFFCVGGQNFQANTSYPVSKYICFLFGGKFNFLPDHPIDPYFVGGLGFDLDISSSKPPAPFAYQIGVGSEFEIVKRGLFIYTEMSAHVVDGNNLLFAPIRLGLDFKI
jgi:hypothetical protein